MTKEEKDLWGEKHGIKSKLKKTGSEKYKEHIVVYRNKETIFDGYTHRITDMGIIDNKPYIVCDDDFTGIEKGIVDITNPKIFISGRSGHDHFYSEYGKEKDNV